MLTCHPVGIYQNNEKKDVLDRADVKKSIELKQEIFLSN